MICRSCYGLVRDLEWRSHTQQLCSGRRSQFLSDENVEICRHHPREQAPALLLGGICPLCSPDILVRTVEAAQLRALGVGGKGKSGGDAGVPLLDTNAIYRVDENSRVCNFLDAENCPDSECPCKRQRSDHNACTREFWSDYNRNVKHAFDHSLSFKPHATDPCDEEADDDDDARPLVRTDTMVDADLYGFAIRNPPDTVLPSAFLLDNFDEILSHMRDSELLRNQEHDTFRLWIWATTHFVRVAHHNLNPNDDLYECKKHNTHNYYVPGFNGP